MIGVLCANVPVEAGEEADTGLVPELHSWNEALSDVLSERLPCICLS